MKFSTGLPGLNRYPPISCEWEASLRRAGLPAGGPHRRRARLRLHRHLGAHRDPRRHGRPDGTVLVARHDRDGLRRRCHDAPDRRFGGDRDAVPRPRGVREGGLDARPPLRRPGPHLDRRRARGARVRGAPGPVPRARSHDRRVPRRDDRALDQRRTGVPRHLRRLRRRCVRTEARPAAAPAHLGRRQLARGDASRRPSRRLVPVAHHRRRSCPSAWPSSARCPSSRPAPVRSTWRCR